MLKPDYDKCLAICIWRFIYSHPPDLPFWYKYGGICFIIYTSLPLLKIPHTNIQHYVDSCQNCHWICIPVPRPFSLACAISGSFSLAAILSWEMISSQYGWKSHAVIGYLLCGFHVFRSLIWCGSDWSHLSTSKPNW